MSVPISPCTILVLGHSYVSWVGAFVRSAGLISAGLFDDFEVADGILPSPVSQVALQQLLHSYDPNILHYLIHGLGSGLCCLY